LRLPGRAQAARRARGPVLPRRALALPGADPRLPGPQAGVRQRLPPAGVAPPPARRRPPLPPLGAHGGAAADAVAGRYVPVAAGAGPPAAGATPARWGRAAPAVRGRREPAPLRPGPAPPGGRGGAARGPHALLSPRGVGAPRVRPRATERAGRAC